MRFFVFLLLVVSSISTINGQISSLQLNAGVNYVTVGDLDIVGDQLTVEALIHNTGTSVNIVSKHTDPSNVNYLLRIGSFEITTTSGFANFGGVAAAGVTLETNKTYHVAATYNGAFIRYYVNGCLTGEMVWTGNMVTNNLLTAIGQQSSCQCEQFNGFIDEVRIWNVARTQAEIQQNMLDLPNPTTQAGLLAYYKFDNNYTNIQGNAAWNGTPVGNPNFDIIPEPYPSNLHLNATSSDLVCSADDLGVINLSASGAYLPYDYSIDNGTTFSPNPIFENLPAGTYDVSVRPNGNNVCVVNQSITIADKSELLANLSLESVTCANDGDGSAAITPSGGNGADYSFSWSTGNTTDVMIDELDGGDYSVTIRDSCQIAGRELVENGHFEEGYTGFSTDYLIGSLISDQSDGHYNIGVNPRLFHSGFIGQGNNGGGNFMVINSSTSPNQNIWYQTISVEQNTYYNISFYLASMFTYSPAQVQVLANGSPQGGTYVAPNALNSWEQHDVFWYSGNETSLELCFTNLNLEGGGNDFGIDDISVKACQSCEVIFPFTIDEPDPLTIDIVKEDANCFGTEGVIDITANGGTPNYSYSIDDGSNFSTNAIFTDLTPNDYDILVKDDNDCEAAGTVSIFFPDPMQVDISSTDLTCSYSDNGTIEITVIDGVPPYRYQINGGGTQPENVFENLAAGSYDVEVLDVNDCSYTETIVITAPDELILTESFNHISCFGVNDGAITLAAQGGTGDLEYSIDGGASYSSVTDYEDLAPDTYVLRVQDERSCFATLTIDLEQPDEMTIATIVSDETCLENDGEVLVIITGGTTPYVYSIDEGVTTQASNEFTNLIAGDYTVYGYDENLCEISTDITVLAPPPIDLTINSTDISCFGNTDGSIDVEANGGVEPYTYSLDGGDNQLTGLFENLGAASYLLRVVDDEGCSEEVTIDLSQPENLSANVTVDHVLCFGNNDARVEVETSGGTPNYNYSIDNGVTTQASSVFDGLGSGDYEIQVEDINNCQTIVSFTVTEPPVLEISLVNTTPSSCPQLNDGTAEVLAEGGTMDYVYRLDGGVNQTSSTFTGLSSGNYEITVIDENTCEASVSFNIVELPPLTVTFEQEDITCYGDNDGTITFSNPQGGSGNYTYSIDGGSTFEAFTQFTNLQPGFYDVVLKDETGCELIDLVEINEPAPLYFVEELVHIACFGYASGQISFNASSGGIPSYTYSIDDGVTTQASPIFTNLLAGSYKITMLDANGCEWSKQVILTSPPELSSIITSTDLTCYQNNTGTITIEEITGGVAPYTISFDGGQNFGQATSLTGLSAGNYSIVIQDNNDCEYNQTITINQPDELIVNEFVNDASCYGVCDASIGVLANGGTPPYTYQWEGEDLIQNSTEQLGICAGNYELNLTDVNGCALFVPFVVSSPDPIIADFFVPEGTYSILASEVYFQNTSVGANSYIWDFGDQGVLNFETHPSHFYDDLKGKRYPVTLIAINDYGCSDTITQLITIEDRLIYYIPNAFTPNGDELNQTFKPVFNAGFTAEDFTLEIFNRYGELIFVTRDHQIGWDGLYGDFIVPEGTYIWKVTLRERMTDRKVIDTGHVTVLK